MKLPYSKSSVRPEYAKGTWAYALGRSAEQHPEYEQALKLAGKGKRKFNPWWIRAWSDVDAVLADCWFDIDVAMRVPNFFASCLSHGKGDWAGQPFILTDWQQWDVVMPVFGWLRPDGTRRFRKAYLEVPKKLGKSAILSGAGIYFTIADGEQGAEVYSAAGDKWQAGRIHDEAAEMIRRSRSLKLQSRMKYIKSRKLITDFQTASRFEALSADAKLKEGLNWNAVLFDELHVQPNRVMWDTLEFGGINRRQALLWAITTAGVYDPLSLGWSEHSIAMKILDGVLCDWTQHCYLCAADPDDDWLDPRIWWKANPGMNVTIKETDFADAAQKAKDSPPLQNNFKRYRLNLWTHQTECLVTAEMWDGCRVPDFTDEMVGRWCIGGLDLSLSSDMTAFVLWFPPQTGQEKHRIIEHFFLPRGNIDELEKQSNAPYRDWARRGLMHLTNTTRVDFTYVLSVIDECEKQYSIRLIGADPYAFTSVGQQLMAEYGPEHAILVNQNMKNLGPITKLFLDMLADKTLEHRGHPIMGWHVSNIQAIYSRNGDFMFSKSDNRVRFKIDGASAAADALFIVAKQPEEQPCIYDTQGVMEL